MGKKNTLLAWSDAGLSAYAAAKSRRVSRDIQEIGGEINNIRDVTGTNLIATIAVYDLLETQGQELRSIVSKIRDFNNVLENISDHYDENKRREELLGKSRILVLGIQKELNYIGEIMDDYPEFAALQLEHLKSFIIDNNISITNFQHTSFDELQKIDEILSSIDTLHEKVIDTLGG